MFHFMKRQDRVQTEAPSNRIRGTAGLVSSDGDSLDDCSYRAVMHRLEGAFDLLETGKISIDTFEKVALAEQAAMLHDHQDYEHERLYEIEANAHQDFAETLAALEQCLKWTAEFRANDRS